MYGCINKILFLLPNLKVRRCGLCCKIFFMWTSKLLLEFKGYKHNLGLELSRLLLCYVLILMKCLDPDISAGGTLSVASHTIWNPSFADHSRLLTFNYVALVKRDLMIIALIWLKWIYIHEITLYNVMSLWCINTTLSLLQFLLSLNHYEWRGSHQLSILLVLLVLQFDWWTVYTFL